MSDLTVTARGVDELRRKARESADELRAGWEAPRDAAAVAVVDVVRSRTVPVATGRLRAETTASRGAVVSAVHYARPVHARQPYVTQAVALAEADVLRVYESHVDDLL